MRIGPFDFRPSLWPTLATVLLLPVLVGLGQWQLERAAWKQGLVDAHAERISQPARPLQDLLGSSLSGEGLKYRQVTARGRYDLDHQLLLDNRIHQGAAGYHVLTPLRLDGADPAGSWVLIDRGWVPVGPSRAELPALPGPEGPVIVRAMIRLPPEKVFRLEPAEEGGEVWPQVVQQLELAPIERRLGHALLPLVLLLDPDDPAGFVRDWKPVYGITPDKHRAYAAQWYTLAVVLVLIYVGVNTHRVARRPTDHESEHP
ncbi:MAG: SURF1 family protein [Chromatiales bacterium]|jgi:surfeit locus 1 family protein